MEVIKRLDSCGAAACLSKPVSQQVFLSTLAQSISGQIGRPAADMFGEAGHKEKAHAPAGMQASMLQGAHILLAEDNKVNKEIIVEMLTGFGCRVTAAENGRIALDLIRAQQFDLVLMDCQMPEMDGFEAAQRIAAFKKEKQIGPVPVIALTANALKGDRERCLQAGMDDYLSKPVMRTALQTMLMKWLKDRKQSVSAPPAIDPQAIYQLPIQQPPVHQMSVHPLPVSQPQSQVQQPALAMPGIDLTVFKATSEILGNKLPKVISYYLEDAEDYINHIAHALQASMPQDAVRPAHTLKSSSQQFGAMTLAQMAARIEEQTGTSPSRDMIRELQELLVPMRREFAQVKDFYLSSVAQF